jgi:hypothetical protein
MGCGRLFRIAVSAAGLAGLTTLFLNTSVISAQAACLPGGLYTNSPETIVCGVGAGGSFDTKGGDDSVTLNDGGTLGDVVMGKDNDTFTLNLGTVGSVDQGTSGDDAFIYAGSIGTLSQGSGNDELEITGGSVTVEVDQGSFSDKMKMSGGTVASIQQGTGNDSLIITAGATGAIDQSKGEDYFSMEAGLVIDSLDQGGGLDEAYFNGGWIKGLYTDGDYVEFHAGRIGRVKLEKADNKFFMDGSMGAVSIDDFLTAEEGADTFELTSGTIGAYVNSGSGDDIILVDGTDIGSNIVTEKGADTITLTSGTIGGFVDAGVDNDTITLNGATLIGVVNAGDGDDGFIWSSGTLGSFDGGDGSDTAIVTAASYTGSELLDGGDNTSSGDGWVDVLTLDGSK